MTRKDYILISDELYAARQVDYDKHAVNAVDRIIEGLASIFARDNPRFNRTKFLTACGVPAEGA